MEWKKINKLIPKELKDEFRNHLYKAIEKFDIKYELTIMEKLEEIEDIKENNYLKEKLKTKMKHVEYKEKKYENKDEAIEYCINTFNHLDSKNKIFYYNLGEALSFIKEGYLSKKDFIKDMEQKLNRCSAIIFRYISFYKLCKNIPILLECDLSFKEIICHSKEMKNIIHAV